MNIARVAAQRSGRLAAQAIRNQNVAKPALPDVEFLLAQKTMKSASKPSDYSVNKFSNFMVVKYYL